MNRINSDRLIALLDRALHIVGLAFISIAIFGIIYLAVSAFVDYIK